MQQSNTHYRQFIREVENTLSIEHCDSGLETFSPRPTKLPRRMLPYALIACLQGADIELILDDQTLRVESGTAFYLAPNEPHARIINPLGNVKSSWAHLRCTILETVDIFSLVHPPHILPASVKESFLNYNAFMAASEKEKSAPAQMIRDIAKRRSHAFDLLTRLFDCAAIHPQINSIFSNITRLQPVLQNVLNNPEYRYSRSEMAAIIHISPSRLDSLFHETTGKGPLTYLIEQRIRKAATQLISTEKSIQEIALEIGYNNPFYFTKLFKQHTGVTPSAYRKAAHQAHDSLMFQTD